MFFEPFETFHSCLKTGVLRKILRSLIFNYKFPWKYLCNVSILVKIVKFQTYAYIFTEINLWQNIFYQQYFLFFRSSRLERFSEIDALKIFVKLKGKRLCRSLVFNKFTGLMPATLWKKRLWYRCFPSNFAKFLKSTFLIEHLRRLLLVLETSLENIILQLLIKNSWTLIYEAQSI